MFMKKKLNRDTQLSFFHPSFIFELSCSLRYVSLFPSFLVKVFSCIEFLLILFSVADTKDISTHPFHSISDPLVHVSLLWFSRDTRKDRHNSASCSVSGVCLSHCLPLYSRKEGKKKAGRGSEHLGMIRGNETGNSNKTWVREKSFIIIVNEERTRRTRKRRAKKLQGMKSQGCKLIHNVSWCDSKNHLQSNLRWELYSECWSLHSS